MSRPKYARKDANQPQIEAGLEKLGFIVLDVSQLAHLGFDLLVCHHHRRWLLPTWCAVEVKSEDGELTEREAEMQAEMQARFHNDVPLIVARCTEDVLDWYGMR